MIEITETAAMESPESGEAMIDELRRRGVRVAIDDFGTGHSSLARPGAARRSTTLKIDRSFVCDVPGDANAALLVGGIIELARSLGLQPLAEGVETAEQRDFLLARGCKLGQGYFFSRPVPAAEVPGYAPPGARSPASAS